MKLFNQMINKIKEFAKEIKLLFKMNKTNNNNNNKKINCKTLQNKSNINKYSLIKKVKSK